jgi:tetrahedral aminopeptidase
VLESLLREMASFHSVSGNERPFRQWLKSQLEPYADEITVDTVGNLIARRGSSPAVGLFAHMDSVGFIVSQIGEGIVRVIEIGEPEVPQFARVTVLSHGKEIVGVLIKKAGDDERTGQQYFVDVGPINLDTELVCPGDLVAFPPNFTRAGDLILSKGLDNKIGCLVALETFKQVGNAVFVGTVREEQRPSGAGIAARQMAPFLALALVIDVTHSRSLLLNDYPIEIGLGPAICLKDSQLMPFRGVAERLMVVAKSRNIHYQVEVVPSGGSDANLIAREGVPFLFVGVPVRHMHSPNEIGHLRDIEDTIRLLVAFLSEEVVVPVE